MFTDIITTVANAQKNYLVPVSVHSFIRQEVKPECESFFLFVYQCSFFLTMLFLVWRLTIWSNVTEKGFPPLIVLPVLQQYRILQQAVLHRNSLLKPPTWFLMPEWHKRTYPLQHFLHGWSSVYSCNDIFN